MDDHWHAEGRLAGVREETTAEIVCYLGHRIITQTEAVADGYRATAWVVRLDREGAASRLAGSAVARCEAHAVREVQEHARLVIEFSLEDEALRNGGA